MIETFIKSDGCLKPTWFDIIYQPKQDSSFRPTWYPDRDENSNFYRFEIHVVMLKRGRGELVWTISRREDYGEIDLSMDAEERLKDFFEIPEDIHSVRIHARMDKQSLAFRYKKMMKVLKRGRAD